MRTRRRSSFQDNPVRSVSQPIKNFSSPICGDGAPSLRNRCVDLVRWLLAGTLLQGTRRRRGLRIRTACAGTLATHVLCCARSGSAAAALLLRRPHTPVTGRPDPQLSSNSTRHCPTSSTPVATFPPAGRVRSPVSPDRRLRTIREMPSGGGPASGESTCGAGCQEAAAGVTRSDEHREVRGAALGGHRATTSLVPAG